MKYDHTLTRTSEDATMTHRITGYYSGQRPALEFCFYENGGDSLSVIYYWSDSKEYYDKWEFLAYQDGEEIASGVSPTEGYCSITSLEHLSQELDERIDAFTDHIRTYENY